MRGTLSTASPDTRELARRLIALEAARTETPIGGGNTAAMVCEKLRVPLAKLVGTAGFWSLMSRALAMSKAEDPVLDAIHLRPDGSMEGFDLIGRTQDSNSGVVVVAQLLGLLVTFIGESLALRFVRDAWPNASATGIDGGSGEGL